MTTTGTAPSLPSASHRSSATRRSAVAIALVSLPIAAIATPLAAAPRVRLSYRGAAGCPDETAFVAAVAAQAQPFERAPRSAARVRSIDAEIAAAPSGFSGVLRLREADGTTSSREVGGDTCAEVFSALALVAALTVDTGPPPPNPPPAVIEELPPPPPPAPHWLWSTSVHGGAFFAMAPSPAWGVAPSLEAAPPLSVPLTLHLGAVLALAPRADTTAGTAEFLWLTARLGVGVTPRVLTFGPLALSPLVDLGLGIVRGRGASIASPREQVRPWLDAGFGARARWMIVPRLGVELAAGVLVPITRDIWVFQNPQVTVHETPQAGGYLVAGLRVVLAK